MSVEPEGEGEVVDGEAVGGVAEVMMRRPARSGVSG